MLKRRHKNDAPGKGIREIKTIPEILFEQSAEILKDTNRIAPELYVKNDVKRGLRNANGTGVVVGLTHIGEVNGYMFDQSGNKIPQEGKLYYRGYDIEDLVASCLAENRFGFEPEITAKISKMRIRIAEVPISYEPRSNEEGKKIGFKDGLRAIYVIFKYR